MKSDTIILIEDLTVSFDGFLALRNLNFTMQQGELRFVIGPNGAGKTTLLDVITGKVKPGKGQVMFDAGTNLSGLSPHKIANLGVGRKFQTPTVFPQHTVFENMVLALHSQREVFNSFRIRPRPDELEEIENILKLVELQEKVDLLSGLLSHGQKQWLEIAMVIAQDPKLLLLDEPVAGMTAKERQQTGKLIQRLAETRSVLVIEHDMEFVRALARTVTVLHQGTVLCEGPMEVVQNNPIVIDVYLGRS